jgi:hypothetical protein
VTQIALIDHPDANKAALACGISRRFTDASGYIIGPAWNRAHRTNDPVGTCRHINCGGVMMAVESHTDHQKNWYGAACSNCNREIAIRDDHPVIAKSSRQAEMPTGKWDSRIELRTRMAKLGKREGS